MVDQRPEDELNPPAVEADGVDGTLFAFSEPSGVAAAGPNRLLVADTNRHRIIELLLGVRPQARIWAA